MTDTAVINAAICKAVERDRQGCEMTESILAFLDHCHIHGIHLDHVEAGRLAKLVREVTA